MNIFTKITLRSLKQNKLRTMMTIVGVILSVAMISGVLAFATSFQYFMVQYDKQLAGDWYACVYSPKEADLLRAKKDKRTAEIGTYQEIGYIKPEGLNAHYMPYIYIVAPDKTLVDMAGVDLLEGRMPKNDRELVLPVTVSTEGGKPLKLGEKISGGLGVRIAPAGGQFPEGSRLTADIPYEEGEALRVLGQREYTVVGIVKDVSIKSYSTPGYMAFSAAAPANGASDESDESDGSRVAYIRTKNPDNIISYVNDLFPGSGEGETVPDYTVEFNYNLLMYLGATHFGEFSTMLSIASGVLIFLIMIGSIALIYNTFSITVGERKKEYGILSSIGATRKQQRISVFTEGLLIGIIGIPLGMMVGIGGIWMALKIMGRFVVTITEGDASEGFGLHLHIPILILMAILSLVTVLISVAVPAARASRISIIDAIRHRRYVRERNQIFKIPKIVEKHLEFEQILSNKYFIQSGRKYRATIISLTLSITLFISANFVGSYFIDEGAAQPLENSSYNVEYMQPILGEEPAKTRSLEEIAEKLSAAPGIKYKRSLEFGYLSTEPESEGMGTIMAVMEEKDYSTYLISIGIFEQHPLAILLENKLSEEGTLDLYTSDQKHYTVDAGDLLARRVTAKNVPPGIESYVFDQVVVMSRQTAMELFGSYESLITDRGIFFKCQDPAKTYAAMEKICREEGFPASNLRNVAEDARDMRNLAIMVNVFAYGFVILISLIAIVNVFNTISTNIMVRRREFAVLRAVGMTEKGFRRMMGYESLIYGVRSLLLSLGISLIISLLLYSFFWLGGGFSFLIPWRAVIISVIIVLLAVFATVTYAVGKINRENLMSTLKNENL